MDRVVSKKYTGARMRKVQGAFTVNSWSLVANELMPHPVTSNGYPPTIRTDTIALGAGLSTIGPGDRASADPCCASGVVGFGGVTGGGGGPPLAGRITLISPLSRTACVNAVTRRPRLFHRN